MFMQPFRIFISKATFLRKVHSFIKSLDLPSMFCLVVFSWLHTQDSIAWSDVFMACSVNKYLGQFQLFNHSGNIALKYLEIYPGTFYIRTNG